MKRKCRSRCRFGESGAWRESEREHWYKCGLENGHEGMHRGFELVEVASWPAEQKKPRRKQ